MNRDQDSRSYKTKDCKLVIHLYRNYRIPVTVAAESTEISSATRGGLLETIQEHQADFLSKIAQLRHNYVNYITLISESGERTNHRGIFQNPVGWYQKKEPEYYERFKQVLLDIRSLLPSLPASQLEIEDEALIDNIRRFETEANAVIVNPVRDMALKVLTRTLVGEGVLTEQAMIVYFNLKDSDFTWQGFSKVMARIIANRRRLYFRKNVDDTLLANNINVLQGQLDGHCSHLMTMLTSRDMSGFVRSTLRAIRYRHLPLIMKQVVKDLSDLDQYRPSIYSHTMFREKVCLKDLVLHNVTITPGYLAECLAAIEPLTKPFDPEDAESDMELVALRVVQHVARTLDRLHQFGMGIRRLPERELDLKITFLRTQFAAGVDSCLDFLGNYNRIFDRVVEAVQPLMGLISFDSGGQSEFYARWFPGLNNTMQRNELIHEYIVALERLKEKMAGDEEKEAELKKCLESWITPDLATRCSGESPHIDGFVGDDLIEVLTSLYLFLRSLSRIPDWFYELEAGIFADIDEKKAQAQSVIASGKD